MASVAHGENPSNRSKLFFLSRILCSPESPFCRNKFVFWRARKQGFQKQICCRRADSSSALKFIPNAKSADEFFDQELEP
jgi:hypothetical protein